MLTIIYPKISVPSGNRTYANRIMKGLQKKNYEFRAVGIRKVEISLFGKPYGGILSQRIQLRFHSFREHPLHSLVPETTPRNCDVVTVHDVIPLLSGNSFISSIYDRKAYELMYQNVREAKVLISSTKFGVNEITESLKVEPERVRVVYESIDHETFYYDAANPYPDNNKIHLLTVGDFNPRKRFDLLYQIYGGREDLELYHIGPVNSWHSYFLKAKEIADKFKNIHILGPKPSDELRRYFSNADLFVYYSEAEGFGLTPIEAMATGTNVLVNDLPIFHETMGEYAFYSGKEGFLEETYKALSNRKPRNVLIEYSKKYSLEREIDALIEIYEEIKK